MFTQELLLHYWTCVCPACETEPGQGWITPHEGTEAMQVRTNEFSNWCLFKGLSGWAPKAFVKNSWTGAVDNYWGDTYVTNGANLAKLIASGLPRTELIRFKNQFLVRELRKKRPIVLRPMIVFENINHKIGLSWAAVELINAYKNYYLSLIK